MRNPHSKPPRFVKRYRHYWTGKIMIAEEYGYESWCFGNKRK